MKGKKSAGLLLFRRTNPSLEVLLVHPGGPFWKNKDAGSWSIPKGEFTNEAALDAALREVKEEIGFIPTGKFLELTPIKQRVGKTVFAWAVEFNCDVSQIQSNTFSMEWPPRSGKLETFPEVDRAGWFTIEEARSKILASQLPLIDEAVTRIGR
jgi:predicted NUDIX family NTP pyrophosphohydrolase